MRQHTAKKHEKELLDVTVEENEWNKEKEKLSTIEEKVEEIESKLKYNSIGVSDLQETVDALVKIVEEQDGVIRKLESEVKFLLFEENPELSKCDDCGKEEYFKHDMIHHRAEKHRDIAIKNGEIMICETSNDILVWDLRTEAWRSIDSQRLFLCLP